MSISWLLSLAGADCELGSEVTVALDSVKAAAAAAAATAAAAAAAWAA